jgi:CRP-like cAMP-binding protein
LSVAAVVSSHPLLAGLPPGVVDEVAGCARNVAFPAGALLLAEGDPADTAYLVRRGRVAIEVRAPGPGSLVIETVGPGSVVGWSWLIPPYSWRFDARAIDPVGAIALNAACLRDKADRDAAVGYALMTRVAGILLDRLQATRVRMLDIYGTPGGR